MTPTQPTPDTTASDATPPPAARALRHFGWAAAALSLAFILPLVELVRFALGSYLYSHIVLVPFASAFMVWIRRTGLPPAGGRAATAAITCSIAALAALSFALFASPSPALEPTHRLTWTVTAWVLGLAAAGCWFLGPRLMRAVWVPVAFLLFSVPMPGWLERAIETGLQYGSAEAVNVLFHISGMPFVREGQVFRLPTITLEVAQECSGIHSTLVLFITSIVAGQMFLPRGWRRWALTLAVIPLAIVRNGFRVLVLGELCVRMGPHMIESWIHHRGGPIFFALSLIPFLIILVLLHRVGRRPRPTPTPR